MSKKFNLFKSGLISLDVNLKKKKEARLDVDPIKFSLTWVFVMNFEKLLIKPSTFCICGNKLLISS